MTACLLLGGFGLTCVLGGLLLVAGSSDAQAQRSSIKINEKTKFYRITGKTAAEFAISMSKRGPYSRQHGRRAWANPRWTGREVGARMPTP